MSTTKAWEAPRFYHKNIYLSLLDFFKRFNKFLTLTQAFLKKNTIFLKGIKHQTTPYTFIIFLHIS